MLVPFSLRQFFNTASLSQKFETLRMTGLFFPFDFLASLCMHSTEDTLTSNCLVKMSSNTFLFKSSLASSCASCTPNTIRLLRRDLSSKLTSFFCWLFTVVSRARTVLSRQLIFALFSVMRANTPS